MNVYIIITAIAIAIDSFFHIIIDYLNYQHFSTELPKEFENLYEPKEYEKSQKYQASKTKLVIFRRTLFMTIIITFLLAGGFEWTFSLVNFNNFYLSAFLYLLIFFGSWRLIIIPFQVYNHFVIEEKYGFNKMTFKTYIFDWLKNTGIFLALFGGAYIGILSSGLYLKAYGWLLNWGIGAFVIMMLFLFKSIIIEPLFYKFTPIEDQELKEELIEYADSLDYQYSGIYTINASKRTTKANASVIGFGRLRRIVLYDNLLNKYNNEEILAVFGHEVGHDKKKHIILMMLYVILTYGIGTYLYHYLAIANGYIYYAFEISSKAIFVGFFLVFLLITQTPLLTLYNWLFNMMSRRFEYQADAFAVKTTEKKEPSIQVTKKLNAYSYHNLTPHPLKVFFDYTHPPVLKRIEAIREIDIK